MIPWLIGSILLSCTGALMYRWVHAYLPQLGLRKGLIYGILLLSLILPGFYSWNGIVAGKISHEIKEVAASETAHTVNEFCHCEKPGSSEVILFQANRVYDFVLQRIHWMSSLLGITALILLVVSGLSLFKLLQLTRKLPRRLLKIDDFKISLLESEHNATASFRLFGKFIIWNRSFDLLSSVEKNAVLSHEISHLKQFNTYENIALMFLQCFWFVNPAFYFFRKELEYISEFIADEKGAAAMGSKKDYASLLLRLKVQPSFSGVMAFQGSSLKLRIRRLIGQEEQPRRYAAIMTLLVLFSLLAVNHLSSAALKQQQIELKLYQAMAKEHALSGKDSFCRTCTMEDICSEE